MTENNQLANYFDPAVNLVLLDGVTNPNRQSQIRLFTDWLNGQQLAWWQVDLADYRAYLLSRPSRYDRAMSPSTVNKYLEAVYTRLRKLIGKESTRDLLYSFAPQGSLADRKAFVDEIIARMISRIDPNDLRVSTVEKRDLTDEENLHLDFHEASKFIVEPVLKSHTEQQYLRDRAVKAALLATGLRIDELVHLDVSDLNARKEGRSGVLVREGKGIVQRIVFFVPEFDDWWAYLDIYRVKLGITSGAVFRGLKPPKKPTQVMATALDKRPAQRIVENTPIIRDDQTLFMSAHRTRHSYARMLYMFGYPVEYISRQMGHRHEKTTWGYIGDPTDVRLTFDRSQLKPR